MDMKNNESANNSSFKDYPSPSNIEKTQNTSRKEIIFLKQNLN
jgi:hypothetical protein